ncbi:hypothetical protein BD769DRAFT_1356793, partial [Suillus cothurnatus]
YHSHCDAAIELLKYLDHYIWFFKFISDNKTNSQFNHMEENLTKALHDNATLIELAVLTLYSQAIMKPYMWMVHAPGTIHLNILDLGLFHISLIMHIKGIIANPLLLLNCDPRAYIQAVFDHLPWDNSLTVETVLKMFNSGRLPHLNIILVASF